MRDEWNDPWWRTIVDIAAIMAVTLCLVGAVSALVLGLTR
jgi:hypothetical protein